MKPADLPMLAAAWLRPKSLWPLLVVYIYGQYLLAVIDRGQPTADVYLAWLLAAASPGVWLGHCARDALVWPGALFVPGYTRILSGMAVVGGGVALAVSSLAAWAGGLAPWGSVAYGVLAISATLLAGFLFRYFALVALVAASVALMLTTQDAPATVLPAVVHQSLAPSVAALVGAILLVCFLEGVRAPLAERPLSFADQLRHGVACIGRRLQFDVIVSPRWRIVCLFGGAAVVAAIASRSGAIGVQGSWWLFACTLASTIFTAQAASFPRGHLAAATSFLLLGVGTTRADIGRRIMWRATTDSFLGAAVFTAVAIALGAAIELDGVLVALAACHLYVVAASGSKWLLSSRSSVLVAIPFVMLLTWFGSRVLPAGLLAATATFVVSVAIAIYWGGRRLGRLDFVG